MHTGVHCFQILISHPPERIFDNLQDVLFIASRLYFLKQKPMLSNPVYRFLKYKKCYNKSDNICNRLRPNKSICS